MRLKLTRPLVILDVETTGTHPQLDRVVQIGLVKVYPDGRVTKWAALINPGIPIPPEVSAIHGITDEAVKDSKPFKEIAAVLAGGLMGCDVAGFNVRFDVLFLKKEFERVGGRAVLDGIKIVDAFRIYVQKRPRDLTAAVKEYLGEDLENAHDALADAWAAWRVIQAQLEQHTDLPDNVAELHEIFFERPAEGFLDPDGKLAWRFGRATINFGKWATHPLEKTDRSYLEWMLRDGDFTDCVKRIVREALKGNFPKREDL